MIIETSRDYFSISSFRRRALKHFVAIWATLPRQLWRPEVWKSIATFTPTSQQIEMEFWWKNRRNFWMPVWSFYRVRVWHKVCVTHRHDENYMPCTQKLLSFFHQNSIWICWDVVVKVAIDFQTSGLHNCRGKVAQIATKCLSARWRKLEMLKYSREVSMIILLDI